MLLTPVLKFGDTVMVEDDGEQLEYTVEYRMSIPRKGDDPVMYSAVLSNTYEPEDGAVTRLILIDKYGVSRLVD